MTTSISSGKLQNPLQRFNVRCGCSDIISLISNNRHHWRNLIQHYTPIFCLNECVCALLVFLESWKTMVVLLFFVRDQWSTERLNGWDSEIGNYCSTFNFKRVFTTKCCHSLTIKPVSNYGFKLVISWTSFVLTNQGWFFSAGPLPLSLSFDPCKNMHNLSLVSIRKFTNLILISMSNRLIISVYICKHLGCALILVAEKPRRDSLYYD